MQFKGFKTLCMVIVFSMLSVSCGFVFAEPTVVDGVTHFGTVGEKLTIEAELVTINAETKVTSGADAASSYIQMQGMDVLPQPGSKGDIEFSFNTGKAGEFVVWMYANPSTLSKTVAFSRNNGVFGVVKVGAVVNEFQWTPAYYFTASGDELVKISATSMNGFYKIDKFMVAERGYDPETGVFTKPTTTAPPEPTPTPTPEPTPLPDPNATKIMPVGDSITDGADSGGYRTFLWQLYADAGKNVNYVGSLRGGSSALPDKDHEGHSGWKIAKIDASIVKYVQDSQPDIVLLMLGTNDMLQNDQIDTAPDRLSALIDKIADTKKDVKIFVSSLPLLTGVHGERVIAYNAKLPPMVAEKVSQGKSVYFVDMHPLLTAEDIKDNIHPNAAGYEKLAKAWFAATTSFVADKADALPDDGAVKVTLNGKRIEFDQEPIIENDRTLVPFRKIFEAMEAEVSWDGATQTVTAKKGDIVITLQIGNNIMTKNTEQIILDVPAKLVNDRTLVPVRAIVEGLGAKVDWDGATQTVIITNR